MQYLHRPIMWYPSLHDCIPRNGFCIRIDAVVYCHREWNQVSTIVPLKGGRMDVIIVVVCEMITHVQFL